MASLTQWTWIWASSRRWWRTEKPDMLQFVRLQRVGPVLVTEQEHHQQMQQTKQTENIISSQSAALSSNILRTYSFSHYILSKTQKKLNLEESLLYQILWSELCMLVVILWYITDHPPHFLCLAYSNLYFLHCHLSHQEYRISTINHSTVPFSQQIIYLPFYPFHLFHSTPFQILTFQRHFQGYNSRKVQYINAVCYSYL